MYYLNPSTYWIGGVLAATLPAVQVVCSEAETAFFRAPGGLTCGQYAGDYVNKVLRLGYLTNPEDVGGPCGYCQYKDGTEYLATLNIRPTEKWRDFGVFVIFVLSNWALVYFFIYTVRVKGWSFGLGWVLGAMQKGVNKVGGLIKGRIGGSRIAGQEANEEKRVDV